MQSATVPISLVSDLSIALIGKEVHFQAAVVEAGIAPELLAEAGGRVTVDQFVRFYRRLALILDDETPGFFSRPLKGGVLKYLCLGMLDAPNLNVALHRFAGFFRLLLDDLAFVVERGAAVTRISLSERALPRAPRPLVHDEEERDKPIGRAVINGTGQDQVGTDWTGPHKNTLQRVKMETGPSLAPFSFGRRPP